MTNTVTIGSDTYNIYGSSAGMASYANGRIGPTYTKWRALGTDDKARSLVTTATVLDAMGLIDPDTGDAISESTLIADVINGSYELAVAIGADPSIVTKTQGGSNIQTVTAGPASVTFFAPVYASVLPKPVLAYLSRFIPSADDGTGVGEAPNAGADGVCPTFTNCYDREFDNGGPL